MPVVVVTFGCRVNTFESELMRYFSRNSEDSTIIVNTCAVTIEAERQAKQAIRRLKQKQPESRIIVTGCAVQMHPENFSSMPEVDYILDNTEKLLQESFVVKETVHNSCTPLTFSDRVRAFLPIQQGCNDHCTFCVIPFTRGQSYSLQLTNILAKANTLTNSGYHELVLTGTDLASYGLDLFPRALKLSQLVEQLLTNVRGLNRLRLSSLNPTKIESRLLEILATERRVMPHVHLSIQTGDDIVLKRMRRGYSRTDILKIVEYILVLRPEVTFGADFIVGFPTESEVMFNNTLSLVQQCNLTHLHIFPFSSRLGTSAARMPAIDNKVVRSRTSVLHSLGNTILSSSLSRRVGTTAEVLVEQDNFGYTEDYLPVRLLSCSALPGSIIRVYLTAATTVTLYGEEISS